LSKKPVQAGTYAHAILLPGFGAGKRAHSGTQHFTVTEDRLDPARGFPVAAIRRCGVAAAGIERIADHAAPARIGHVEPKLGPGLLQVPIHVEIRHARLDEARGVAFADLENSVHSLEIEDDTA